MNKYYILKRKIIGTVLTLLIVQFTMGQNAPSGWHLFDKKSDKFQGISLRKAYESLQGRKSKSVIVAVIDSGVDTLHEDLKDNLWVNEKEIKGNGIDDDDNGYVDDIHGWNFLGSRSGKNVFQDSYEVERVYFKFKSKYEYLSKDDVSKVDTLEYKMWLQSSMEISPFLNGKKGQLNEVKNQIARFKHYDSLITESLKKKNYAAKDLNEDTTSDRVVRNALLEIFTLSGNFQITNIEILDSLRKKESEFSSYLVNGPEQYRNSLTKDNEMSMLDSRYGNNDIMAETSKHGTHVAGIIAAMRENFVGMDGISQDVKIMVIRVVPEGDEHDKDVALAIKYAVDNGARIINLSFGKRYSPNKEFVDNAVVYAETKNVLIIHAAGNEGLNIDVVDQYPNPFLRKYHRKANNWITVGASGNIMPGLIIAPFSNYGFRNVDLLAPGVSIYSTLPDNKYGELNGTSMAAPIVSGIACLLLNYFPDLKAIELKKIIEKGVVVPELLTKIPGKDNETTLNNICKSGGIVNAFNSIELALNLTNKTVKSLKTKK